MVLLPLLALLLVLGVSAAVRSGEQAVGAARKAIDDAELDAAETIIADALRVTKRDSAPYCTLRVMRTEVLLSRGKYPEVRQDLQGDLPPHCRKSPAAIQRLLYLAYVANELREDDQRKKQLLDMAEELARRHHERSLPDVYRAKFLLFGNATDGQKTLQLAQKYRDGRTEARARATYAYIHALNGDYVAAADEGERALRIAKKLGLATLIQNVLGNLGWVWFELGNYDMAEASFKEAEAIAARMRSASDQSAWLLQLGNIQFMKRSDVAADVYNRRALELAPGRKEQGYALANLARIAYRQKRYEQARELNARALQAKRAAGDQAAILSSEIVEARLLSEHDRNPAGAETLLRKVLAEGDAPTRLEAQTELARLYVQWKPERAESAFGAAVAIAREERGNITNPELRLTFFNTVTDLYDSYIAFLAERDSGKALEVVEESRAEALEERWVKAPRRFDPEAIARRENATILVYSVRRERSYLWVVTAAGTKMHRLPPGIEIEETVAQYQRLVRQRVPASNGVRLFRTLVATAHVASGSRVIVIPDGRLHLLSFETLQPEPNRYWLEDVTLTSAPSLQFLDSETRRRTTSSSLLLVGNPVSPDPVAYPPLKAAEREMQAIKSRFAKATVLEKATATPAAYWAASPDRFEYQHFVAHGVAGSLRPLDSFIQLSSDGASFKLLARDIQKATLNARLVTIASCEGVGTRTYAGEGVVGLAWAFLHAGADQVIASLWKVDDAATAKLMEEMYAGIAAGEEPVVALRKAKLKLLRSGGPHAKPYYWAPFVLYAGT